jgi:hypothetical protein
MRRWTAAVVMSAVTMSGCAAGPKPAPSALLHATSTEARAELQSLIEDVTAATAYRYNATDDAGHTMDTAKIIWVPEAEAYAAVYHSGSDSDAALHVHLATSTDLMTWEWRNELAAEASQPTIKAASDGGYVVAWDPTTVEDSYTAPVFDYYATWKDLLADRPTKTFAVKLSLSRCGEGTVNLYSASSTFLDVGFHLYADCEVDREGHGTTDWTTWTATRNRRLDDAILAFGVTGGIGDRDAIRFEGADLTIIEAQGILGDWRTFRVYLFDDASGRADLLAPRTHAGSTAFTNPTIEQIEIDGQQAILVTLFVPQEGARGGEAGELIYYRTYGPVEPR